MFFLVRRGALLLMAGVRVCILCRCFLVGLWIMPAWLLVMLSSWLMVS